MNDYSYIQHDEIWKQMSDGFQLTNRLHGPDHWKRVESNGLNILSTNGGDEIVVRLFAVLHDSQRWNDGYDPQHGFRAADIAVALRNELFVVSDLQMDLLCEALRMHNQGRVSDDQTIGICWDADRMDLPRVGMLPDPDLMSTEFGTDWARQYRDHQ